MTTTKAPPAGQRILVVDDDPVITSVVNLILKRGGYVPEVFSVSTDAWTRFAAAPHEFRLLMIDDHMPDLTGSEFIRRVKIVAPTLPIVSMSGHYDQNADSLAGEPMISRLRKPFDIDELLAHVAQRLGS